MATPGIEQSGTRRDQPYGTAQGGAPSDRREANTGGLGGEIRQMVRDKTYEQFDTQKHRATNNLGHLARAVRGLTQSLRDNGQSGLADYVNRAADGIERWSSVLQQQDPEQAVQEIRRFARRNPALFLGAAFGAGVLAGRFFKSSARADDDESWQQKRPYTSRSTGEREAIGNAPIGSVR